MVESAYSLEFNRELDAKKASEYSLTKSLKSDKAFRCLDKDCKIPLTCTNWEKPGGKRFFFRPSHNDEPHVEGCTCITPQEIQEQVKKEVSKGRQTILQSGVISVKKSVSKAKTNNSMKNGGSTVGKTISAIFGEKRNSSQSQDRQLSSLATFVELFNDQDIDHDKPQIRVDGKLISLNDYFVDVTNSNLVKDKNRIFFGMAEVSVANFNKEILQIEFVNSQYPKVCTNLNKLKERAGTRNIVEVIETGSKIVYFRGRLNSKTEKFESFNDKFYKDLHTPKD